MDMLEAAKFVALIEALMDAKLPSHARAIEEKHNKRITIVKREMVELLMEDGDHG